VTGDDFDPDAPDRISVPLDMRALGELATAACEADVSLDGIWDLLRLRIRRLALNDGATFRAGPYLAIRHDPVGRPVLANGTGLTAAHVERAVAEMLEHCRYAAQKLASFPAEASS
jgi:hypothetical protein